MTVTALVACLLPFREASPPRTPGQGPMTDINYTYRACNMPAFMPAGATYRCKRPQPPTNAGCAA